MLVGASDADNDFLSIETAGPDGKLDVPDPASRYNPEDAHGASLVVDPHRFEWPAIVIPQSFGHALQ